MITFEAALMPFKLKINNLSALIMKRGDDGDDVVVVGRSWRGGAERWS